jgi:hypothetical protein
MLNLTYADVLAILLAAPVSCLGMADRALESLSEDYSVSAPMVTR